MSLNNKYLEKIAATREELLKHYASKMQGHGNILNSPASKAIKEQAAKGFKAAKNRFDILSGLKA